MCNDTQLTDLHAFHPKRPAVTAPQVVRVNSTLPLMAGGRRDNTVAWESYQFPQNYEIQYRT